MPDNGNNSIRDRIIGYSLASHLGGRDNNLNLLRVIAATVVLVSHSFVLVVGDDYADPMKAATGFSMGQYAVAVFFCISGLLIAKSFDQRKSIGKFIASRILRLWPALLVALVLTAFFLGPIVTEMRLESYYFNKFTLQYVPSNAILARPVYELPGVFLNNPSGPTVNGSLWSLFYEVSCYVTLTLLGFLGIFSRRKLATMVVVASASLHIFSIFWSPLGGIYYRIDMFLFWWFMFSLGFSAYLFKDELRMGLAGLFLAFFSVVVSYNSVFFVTMSCVFLGYLSLFFAFRVKGKVLLYNKFGDYSYGIYVFSFPIQQSIVYFFPDLSVILNVVFSFLITIIISVCSWHFLEKKALAYADVFAGKINYVLKSASSRFITISGASE